MTRNANARIAGATFLLYIVTGLSSLAIGSPIGSSQGPAAQLAAIAAEPWRIRVTVLLSAAMFVYAFVLGVTLYALTREHDQELAMSGMTFRAGEGVLGMVGTMSTVGLSWLATSPAAASLEPAGWLASAALLGRFERMSPTISAFAFALGSLAFTVVFLRSRSLPRWLAVLGVLASLVLVLVLPLQLAGWASGMAANVVWLPMLVFEVVLALRLLLKGGLAVAGG
jgi:hypothetical protein